MTAGPRAWTMTRPRAPPPSFVSGESKSSVSNSSGGGGPHAGYAPPAVPARPSRNKSTPKSAKFTPTIEEDVVTLQNALAPIVPTILRILSEGNLMTTKNQTTLSLCLNTFAKPHWLRMFLGVPTAQGLDTKPKCANERQAAFTLASKWFDQIKARQDSRNERLRVASFAGDLHEVEAMIFAGADVNSLRDDHTTPLWFASAKGRLATVKILLQHGANPNLADKDGALPVMLAAQEGHVEIVKTLLESGSSADGCEPATVATLMYIAARKGGVGLLEYLLSKHAPYLSVPTPRASTANSDHDVKASPIELALTLAIQQGHLDLVNVLLKYGCDIKVAMAHGITPVLVSAAQSGSEAMVNLLLSGTVQADVNAVDKVGISPLAEAAECGHLSIGRILLDSGADPNLSGHDDGMTPLLLAAQSGNDDFVTMLLQKSSALPANIEAKDSIGSTSLMLASQQGHFTTIDLLLRHDADPNAVDNDGTSALFFAAQEGFSKIVFALLEKGANPNVRDSHGAGPLLVAVQEGHYGIVEKLLDYEFFDDVSGEMTKTDVNAARTDGITAIFTAAYLGREQELELLIEAGADPNPSTANDGSAAGKSPGMMEDTPLCGAIAKGHVNIVRLLIAAGAVVNAPPRASDNLTPFTLARAAEHAEIIQILIEAGANTQAHGGDTSALAPPRVAKTPSTPDFTPPPPGMLDDDDDTFKLDGATMIDEVGVDDADDNDVADGGGRRFGVRRIDESGRGARREQRADVQTP